MRAVATTGRDAHHVLAAKPHPITINAPDSAPEGNPRPQSGENRRNAAHGCPKPPASMKTTRTRLAGGHHRTKKPPKAPGGPWSAVVSDRKPFQSGRFQHPRRLCMDTYFTVPMGVFFSDSSTPGSASAVVCGGGKRKGHRRTPSFSHHPKPQKNGSVYSGGAAIGNRWADVR